VLNCGGFGFFSGGDWLLLKKKLEFERRKIKIDCEPESFPVSLIS